MSKEAGLNNVLLSSVIARSVRKTLFNPAVLRAQNVCCVDKNLLFSGSIMYSLTVNALDTSCFTSFIIHSSDAQMTNHL
jgi:hypothetical protein